MKNRIKYNKYYFSKLFNRSFGCNLSRYVNRIRYRYVLDNADASKNLSEIIFDAGYNDPSVFYKYRAKYNGR
jgi:AraC-like DNA-binding protein